MTSIVLDPRTPKGSRTLHAGVFDAGVYKSTDDGKTWHKSSNGLGHPHNMRVSRVVLHRDGTLFAMICAKRPGQGKPLMSEGVGLYRSNDGAETWQPLGDESRIDFVTSLFVTSTAVHAGAVRGLDEGVERAPELSRSAR